jgi:SAM-dependent methyltransferase
MDEPGPTWSDIAGWYDDLVERGSGPHDTALRCLLDLVPAAGLAGADVLDLACGTGLATRALAARGVARVVGVDSSPEMVERARGHGPAGGPITYVVDDAQVLASRAEPAVHRGPDLLRRPPHPMIAATKAARTPSGTGADAPKTTSSDGVTTISTCAA